MTEPNSNPFVLPGMGQASADMAGNPLLASMEMMRKAWTGLTGPGGLAQALPLATPMNLEDLDRRISELRTVEGWLRMNLSMLSSTIQGMEVQRSTIATLRSFVDSMGTQAVDPSVWTGASPLEVALGLKRPGQDRTQASPSDAPPPDRKAEPPPDAASRADRGPAQAESGGRGGAHGGPAGASAAGALPPGVDPVASAQAIGNAAQSASEAWWGLLQQQFNQIAAATAATMPQGEPEMPADAPDARAAAAGGANAAAARPKGTGAKPGPAPAKAAAAPSRQSGSRPAAKARKPASRKMDPDTDA